MSDHFLDDETQPAYADAPVGEEHLNSEELYGVQRKIFSICTPEGATLEQLAANAKNGLFWEMPAELKNLLKQVNKSNNRSVVSENDLEGDLGKALFLSANVVSYFSDAPKRLAVDIPGLVPTVYTNTGRHNWVIPANCANTVVNKSIMVPDNIFTKYMYAHNQKCDLKTLNRHIRFDLDHNKQFCGMDSKGVGWKVLMDNLSRADSPYADAFDAIYAKNEHIINNPQSDVSHIAQVPYNIGQEIYEAIATPLRKIEEGYVNFSTWKVKISPADKKPWNSVDGLVRDSIVYGSDYVGAEAASRLNTPFSAGLDLEVEYVLNN